MMVNRLNQWNGEGYEQCGKRYHAEIWNENTVEGKTKNKRNTMHINETKEMRN
jgi:hypothetical protein